MRDRQQIYPGSDRLFAPAVTVRIRKVCRLQEDLGINRRARRLFSICRGVYRRTKNI